MLSALKTKKQSWSIVVICYNEAAEVRHVIESAQRVLDKIANQQKEIVVVDDGSRDGSAEILMEIGEKNKRVRVVSHPANLGIGQAIRSGYRNALHENVCVIPADGQFDPRELIDFSVIEKKTFISFYRKKQDGYNLFRRFISRVNNWINRNILGIRLKDVNWVKAFKMDEIRILDLKLESSLVASEVCAKLILRGNQYIEAVSTYHRRKSGQAKGGSFKTVWKALIDTYKLICVVLKYKRELQSGAGKRRKV